MELPVLPLNSILRKSAVLYFFNFTEVYLIYNVSGILQSGSVIQTCVCVCIFFRFFSIVGYHKMLTAVPCAVQVFVVYLFYTQQCVFANHKLLIYPSTPFPLW